MTQRTSSSEVTTVSDFDALFAQEYLPMVRVAYLLLGSEALAEEAVQDAFVGLHRKWNDVDRPGGYLRTSVVNRCRDLLRKANRERRYLRLVKAPPPVELGANHLVDALAALPDRQREVIVLRYYADHSIHEIARILNMREGTVKSTIHRALAELREVIQP